MNLVLIVSPSNQSLTKRAIDSAIIQDVPDVQVLVVDNGSTDGTHEYLRTLPYIMLTCYRPGRGLHYAWNQALKWAFDVMDCPHVLVINNDVELRHDCYRYLIEDEAPFVTGVSVRTYPEMESINLSSRAPHPDFSCFLLRKSVWDAVGPFDESMHIWAGDADYHLRMHQLGIRAESIVLPFLHAVSSTINTAPPEVRDRLCKIADNDRAVFQRKWGFSVGSAEYYRAFGDDREQVYAAKGRL